MVFGRIQCGTVDFMTKTHFCYKSFCQASGLAGLKWSVRFCVFIAPRCLMWRNRSTRKARNLASDQSFVLLQWSISFFFFWYQILQIKSERIQNLCVSVLSLSCIFNSIDSAICQSRIHSLDGLFSICFWWHLFLIVRTSVHCCLNTEFRRPVDTDC